MISESTRLKYHHKQNILYLSFIIIVFLLSACAQVPKESVELSTTVGRDIAEMHRSHKALAIIIYDRIKKDVNRFVDDVYSPYQIREQLRADYDDFKSGGEDSLFAVINKAVKQPDDNQAQKDTLPYMQTFLEVVRGDIESFRKELLDPVLKQEKELLSAIDRSYNQIHYANSIVTGHLASIVKVHDAQDEVLKEFGAEGLRKEIGTTLAETSRKVSEITNQAEKLDVKMADMEDKIKDWKEKFDKLFKKEDN